MGVYIRSMELPKNCFDCPCYHRKIDDGYYDYEICGVSRTIFNDGYSSVTGHKDHIDPFKARLDNCPLVQVPPHGRLSDLDKLAEYVHQQDDWLSETAIHAFCGILCKAPTIIEAEDGE